ncbi:MAG: hypothetical protein O8C61_01850 [Candidatus Methanoperedens sp.]|nr:hypothetical protein [Candidatus Methanoperedens sp.]
MLKKKPSTVEVSEKQSYENIVNKTKRELEEKQKTILELHKLIEKQQEIIKEQKKHSEVTYIPDKHQEEIIEGLKKEVHRYQEIVRAYEESANKLNAELEDLRLMYQKERVRAQEVSIQLDKEREKVSNLERELSKGQGIPGEHKEEIEKKTSLIRELEASAKTLKNNFEEISNRYHEASEKYETEKQNAIRLEMLILDLDKELGLLDIADKIRPKEEETIGIMIKNSR